MKRLMIVCLMIVMVACSPPVPETVVETVVTEGGGETGVVEAEESADDMAMEDREAGAPPPMSEADTAEEPMEAEDEAFFTDYGTNPFVDVTEDNLSTFAVDVDTGSYTVARGYLNDGLMPPADAVRLEEFVNFFEQDYAIPQDNAFLIDMDGAPTPFSPDGNIVMRVGIQGFEVENRPDANLIFVIDVSGSMDGPDRLGAVKEALYTLTDELRNSDEVGIVVYGSQGRVLLDMTPVSDASQIVLAIDRLQSEGSTNAEEGLRLAYEMATSNYDEDEINRIILLSDGVANVGATGPDSILETVRTQAREGITLSTVGFGLGNFNDTLMEQLANDGDGQYFYVDGPTEAERVFVDDLTGTLLTIARDAKIQVEFNPQTVQTYRLMGYENREVADEDFRNDEVDAGEIGAGHTVTALYEVVPVENAQGTLATARLRWEDPETGEVTEIEQSFAASDVLASFEEAPATFRLSVGVAAFADVLSGGAWGQAATLEDIAAVTDDVMGDLGQDERVSEFMELVEQAISLR